jgi:hypothetical protein
LQQLSGYNPKMLTTFKLWRSNHIFIPSDFIADRW